MPFDLAIKPFFWANVKIDLPGDFAERITGEFQAKFKRLKTAEHAKFMAWVNDGRMRRLAAATGQTHASPPMQDAQGNQLPECTDAEILQRVLMDWRELSLEGANLAFTPENMEKAEEVYGVRAALVVAFFEHGKDAPTGNSAALPAISSAP